MDLITAAIPFFFLLMGVELVAGWRRGRRVFRAKDVATNLALGVLQVLVTIVAAGLLSGLYLLAFRHRLVTLPDDPRLLPAIWVGAFVLMDLLYYLFHRASHRVMLLWATHAPHHSSEDYNLAVALRQGPLQPLASIFFYLPLGLLGVPFPIFATVSALNTLYQFWVHTELVGKLGPVEWLLSTPSHHRVHHGCNGRYLDKNHGGVFIVWDRLLGTFESEVATPVYGTVKPLGSFSPLAATLTPLGELWAKVRASHGVKELLLSVLGPPEWLPRAAPAALQAPPVTGPRRRYDTTVARTVGRYVAVQFVVTLGLAVVFMVFAGKLSPLGVWAVTVWLLASFIALGLLLDNAPHARLVEILRLCGVVPLGALLLGSGLVAAGWIPLP
jgi:alkylglycerol monooxygenase